MSTTGIYVQKTEPYENLFLVGADHWARVDDQVFVYDGDDTDPVAEVVSENFVSAVETTLDSIPAESLDHTIITNDTEESA